MNRRPSSPSFSWTCRSVVQRGSKNRVGLRVLPGGRRGDSVTCADEVIEEDVMAIQLVSKRPQVADSAAPIEFCFQQGWTDGLPVVPPTADRVAAMLEAARLDA